MKHNPSWKRSW